MAKMQNREAPGGTFTRTMRLMTPWERGMVFAGIPLLAVALIQIVTQVIVQMILGEHDFKLLGIFTYVGQWFTPDPAASYGLADAGVLHWVIAGTLITIVTAVIVTIVRVRGKIGNDPQKVAGLADLKGTDEQVATGQLVARAATLRPSLAGVKATPEMVGFRIGTFRGRDVWVRVEDPTILVGPSRAGKGFFLLLWWILSAPGAVITTSSKLDNMKITLKERERQGSTCWIFAPGIPDGDSFGHILRWDPIEGCVDENTLVRRIRALIPKDSFSGSTSNGGHWDTLGQQLASHLIHAAACGGKDVDTVWEWVSSPQRAKQAVRMIREHPDGLPEHADHLESVINMPPEQRASQWGVLPTVLAFLESRAARWWMKPEPDERFDPVEFILGRGTLYLVGDKAETASYLRILDGLLAELDYITKGLAGVSPGDRLDPPVTYILDEAGNIEYQGLYELITAGGGRGRVAVAVFQSKAQLQQYGGPEVAETLWDAATAKIVLPGGADPRALDDMAKLIGEVWVERESHSVGAGPGSVSFQTEREQMFTASDIRTLESGYAFLFYRNLAPILAKCDPFSEHPDFDTFLADARSLTADAMKQSQFAVMMDAHRTQNAADQR